MASRVRQLIGMPSTTCVPRVSTTSAGTCSARIAPAITDRAALPVHNVTRCGIGRSLESAVRGPTRARDTAGMTVDVRPAASRFHTQLDWLDSWHSFSFGPHHDPANTGHGLLLVNNDDVVRGGGGFATHPHRDMEIVTWVLDGELEHRDSTGTVGVIYPGLAQRMSAGTGIQHSEMNASATADVHLVQMWVAARHDGIPPGYEQRDLNDALAGGELVAGRVGAGPRRRGLDPPARRGAVRGPARRRRRGRPSPTRRTCTCSSRSGARVLDGSRARHRRRGAPHRRRRARR